MLNKQIQLAKWSIKVLKSNDFITKQLNNNNLNRSTLQAKDVSDVPAEFVADPFIITRENKLFMFFEVFNNQSEKGEIGLATSLDGVEWNYDKIVLSEKFHLSYPYVFTYEGQFYMIPETEEANEIILYKARDFPYEWENIGTIIHGKYIDPSIFMYRDKWWMFAGANSGSDLHLFYSNDIAGNWFEHPMSPIISNSKNNTRPGGRVIVNEGSIYRYTQDSTPYYGSQVRSFKVKKLSENEYQEEEVNIILTGSNKENDWRKDGMHHIDQIKINDHQWLIAIDGHFFEYQTYFKWKFYRFLRNPISSLSRLACRYKTKVGGFLRTKI